MRKIIGVYGLKSDLVVLDDTGRLWRWNPGFTHFNEELSEKRGWEPMPLLPEITEQEIMEKGVAV